MINNSCILYNYGFKIKVKACYRFQKKICRSNDVIMKENIINLRKLLKYKEFSPKFK